MVPTSPGQGNKVNLRCRWAKLDLLVEPNGWVRGVLRPSRLVWAEGWTHLSWSRPLLFLRSVGRGGACDGPGSVGRMRGGDARMLNQPVPSVRRSHVPLWPLY